jgi:small subunit ribosomal protein S3Ae
MAQVKAAEKWKQKKWFNLYAPKIFDEAVIGEVPGNDEKNLIGRVIKVNMSWITHKPDHSFITVALRVINVNGDAAHTDIAYIEETYSYLHSLVKRRQSAIYTVDKLRGKDGKDFILKLLVMTRNKIETPKKTGIRHAITAFANEYASSMTIEEFVNSLISNKFQSDAAGRVGNIAQVGRLELKRIDL